MLFLPSALESVFMNLSVAFTEPTAARMAVLMVGMILARGRRTITAALRVMGSLAGLAFCESERPMTWPMRRPPPAKASVPRLAQ